MDTKQTKSIYWKTKDGRLIAVKDMSNSHVLNTHRYMQRRLAELTSLLAKAWSFLTTLSGEMAQECMEREIDVMEDRQCNIQTWVWAFEEEIDKRKLTSLKEE